METWQTNVSFPLGTIKGAIMRKYESSRYIEGNREAVVSLVRNMPRVRPFHRTIVELFEDGELKHTIDTSSHSIEYAEDAAENWVMRVGSFD
jgi:hypothetical protein